ncbi:multicopper oxidase domain-containing protein [Mycolicibacterium celeriflavum]|uniref:multicopper oxidase domain-containing protein n=1 Tax=Mycolicibacterium celeriflavum TaxID=1249101 RepID=UPI001F415D42|nr:multicopper oxidase domain-containing protein [Mycolicibacterium celeriflavum]
MKSRQAGPRGPVMVWANVVVLGWLAVAIALLAAHDLLGLPVWVALHVLLLGAVTNAIVIWSEHFVATLCRVPGPRPRRLAVGLVALNMFSVAALTGVTSGATVLTGVGGAGVAAIATVHTVHLSRVGKGAPRGPFGYLIGFYVAASLSLIAGAVSGAGLALGVDGWYARLWAAHVHLMLLGWVGLSVVGTLFTLWPVTTGARITVRTFAFARSALFTLVAGLALAVGGLLAGSVWVTAAGLACYTVGIGVAIVGLWPRRQPRGPAAWMLAAATAWLGGAVLNDAIGLIAAGSVDAMNRVVDGTVIPVLVAGFAAQVLVGALTQLLPVVLSRGPSEHKAIADILAQGWQVRVLAANIAVPMVAGGWSSPVPQIGWALAAVSVAVFVVLAMRVAVSVALHGAFDREAGGERLPGTTTGVVAGLCAVALAAALGISGHQNAEVATVSGEDRTVDVVLGGMRIRPDTVTVPAGTRLVLRVTNQEAMPHDLRLDSGLSTPRLGRGETALLDVGTVNTERQAWCAVAGHKAAGMTMMIRIQGDQAHSAHDEHDTAAAVGLDLSAEPSPGWVPRDAALAPASGTLHRVELRAAETELEVAPGLRERRWTFAGSAPGPTLRGRVGDQFEITLVNDSAMGHGIDFHAGALAPDGPMRTIGPGERLVYRFTADRAGAWLYHCSTMPMSQHIGNGMYGAVIIDPPGLPPVDREFALVAAQLYLGDPGGDAQSGKIRAGQPDGWMFNGVAAQYVHAPLTAHPGERVRIWVVNAGPSDASAFHVVGGQFDTVYKEGAWLLRPDGAGGAQVLDLSPAQGGFVELIFPEPGRYPFVDHDMRHAENGARGIIAVTEAP